MGATRTVPLPVGTLHPCCIATDIETEMETGTETEIRNGDGNENKNGIGNRNGIEN